MTTKSDAKKAYFDMCELNLIPKSPADELIFTAGFMAGRLQALEDQIKQVKEKNNDILGD